MVVEIYECFNYNGFRENKSWSMFSFSEEGTVNLLVYFEEVFVMADAKEIDKVFFLM